MDLRERKSEMKNPCKFFSNRDRSGGRAPTILVALIWCWSAPALSKTDASQAPGVVHSSSTQQGQALEPSPATLTGDWGGLRTGLYDDGIDLSGDFKGELASDPEGGTKFGATEVSQFTFGATIDAQKLFDLTGVGNVAPGGWRDVEGLSFFFNFIQADRATTIQDNQVSAGLFYSAPFASRPDDQIGVGLARTDYNDRAAEAISLANSDVAKPRAEYTTEVDYSYFLTSWLTERPDLQYIFDPGGYGNRTPALVIGARTDVVL